MKSLKFWPAALAVVTLCGGLVAGSALAGGGAGPNGVAGKAAAAAAPQFPAAANIAVKGAVVVNADGTVARKSAQPFTVTSAAHLSTGSYEVIWNRNVRGCAYIATIGLSGSSGSSPSGEITVVGRVNRVRGVFLTTHDSTGTLADRGFHLVVVC